jgi:hypothetical protein
MTLGLATLESPLPTLYGRLASSDAATSAILRWVFGDLAASAVPSGDEPLIEVRTRREPWEHWEIRVNEDLIEPATDRDGMLLALVNHFDNAAASHSELALSGGAVGTESGAVLIVGQEAAALALTAARTEFALLGTSLACLTGARSTGFAVQPYPRAIASMQLSPLGVAPRIPDELIEPAVRWVPVTSVPGTQVATSERPLVAIVLRRPGEGAPALEPVGPAELTHHLCVADARIDTAAGFHAVSALARSARTFSLTGAEVADDLPALLFEAVSSR